MFSESILWCYSSVIISIQANVIRVPPILYNFETDFKLSSQGYIDDGRSAVVNDVTTNPTR
jgi:hypothetical protein